MRTIDAKVRELIGDMTINLLAAQDHAEATAAQRNAAYEMLDACILSGQVPENEVPKMLEHNPDFEEWRKSRG